MFHALADIAVRTTNPQLPSRRAGDTREEITCTSRQQEGPAEIISTPQNPVRLPSLPKLKDARIRLPKLTLGILPGINHDRRVQLQPDRVGRSERRHEWLAGWMDGWMNVVTSAR